MIDNPTPRSLLVGIFRCTTEGVVGDEADYRFDGGVPWGNCIIDTFVEMSGAFRM